MEDKDIEALAHGLLDKFIDNLLFVKEADTLEKLKACLATTEEQGEFLEACAVTFQELGMKSGMACRLKDGCQGIYGRMIEAAPEWNRILLFSGDARLDNSKKDGKPYLYSATYDRMMKEKLAELKAKPAPIPEPVPVPSPKPAPEPVQEKPKRKKAEPKVEKPKPKPSATVELMLKMVKAGLRNLWMHGPAGCGKTTMAAQLAEQLGVECYVLSCSKDTDPSQIQGRRYPQPEGSKLTEYYEKPSVLVLDEFTSIEADTAMLLNSALANGYYETSTKRMARRHPECIIIATSNTLGMGGDALYCGNSRFDASTRDRFACGFVAVDYSEEYENQFDKEVVEYARKLREVIKHSDLQQICSTRTIIHADMLKKAGLDWKASMLSTWSDSEKSYLPV